MCHLCYFNVFIYLVNVFHTLDQMPLLYHLKRMYEALGWDVKKDYEY